MHAKRILCLWCTMKTTNHMVNPICELVVTQNQTPSIDQGNSSVIITKVKFKTKRGYFYTLSLPVPTPKPTKRERERSSTVVDLRVLQNNCLNLHALNSPTTPLFRMSVIVINRIPIRSRPCHPSNDTLSYSIQTEIVSIAPHEWTTTDPVIDAPVTASANQQATHGIIIRI